MKTRTTAILILILAAAAAWKVFLLLIQSVPFNADEAVVGLMARHILQGERPVFFYGQAYMGSLDAYLVAGVFALFGPQVWGIRFVQILLYTGTIITTAALARAIFGSWKTGIWAAVLLAVPTVNVTLYTTASLGGYGEALLIGNGILLLALRIANELHGGTFSRTHVLLWLGLGFLAGLGLWANGLTLIYTVPAGFLVLFSIARQKRPRASSTWLWVALGIVGFGVGASPWWLYAATQGWQALVLELGGSAVAVEQASWLGRFTSHLFNLVLLGGTVLFGFRPPWDIRWLGLPLLPFVLFFWVWVVLVGIRRFKHDPQIRMGWLLLAGVAATFCAGFLFTSFGVDPSGRYFLPLGILCSLAAADALQQLGSKLRWQLALIALVIIYQGWGTLDSALRNPPGITTQFDLVTQADERYRPQLIQFLESQGETRGYTTYWVAYPVAFLSEERILLVPRLPYHADLRYTARDDRYPPYDQLVRASEHIAFVTSLNPALDERLVAEFRRLGVTWQEQVIGDYRVYYHLSRAIHPEELQLGVSG